jgi:hypothetical protein
MTLAYNLVAGEQGEVVITDVLGNIMGSYKLSEGENYLPVSITNASNGVYLCLIKVNNTIVKTEKIIIEK